MKTPKELVVAYMNDVWVNRNTTNLDTYISTKTFIQHNPHLDNGIEALRNFLPHLFNNMMPEGTWQVERVIADDQMVVVHSLAKPTAEALGMVVVDIFRVENNKIVEHWDVTADVPETTVSGNAVI
ncbi:nuclear transport factor 2 family protein [Psychroserpens sp. S379A]|uniref:nuclear transport factor 2 family protein n=1 Tax=Psychroserpens sp. S379A TaxID=3415137 RepID=UPI003C7990CC